MIRSPSWRDRPIMALDLEATGLDPFVDRPVALALAYLDPEGRVMDSRAFLVNPEMPISPGATQVHGITDERAATGTPYRDVLAYLARRLERALDRGEPLVMMNARYDWTMLCCLGQMPEIPILDPIPIDRTLDKYRPGKRTLGDLTSVYRLNQYRAHTPQADAIQAGLVLQSMARVFAPILDRPLPDLMAWQAAIFEEWRQGINAHWREIGKDQQMAPGWPQQEREP